LTGKTGKPLHYNAWRRRHFDPAVRAAGLADVTPHDLRATHATWVADRHGVMAAARGLGHANVSVTTRHYAQAVEGRDREIVEEFDIDHGTEKGPKDHLARTWHGEEDEDPLGVLTRV
jgi:integrase